MWKTTQITPYDTRLKASSLLERPLDFPPTSITKEAIFREAKTIRYVLDQKGKDVWQSPEQTSILHTGDCEDIAIWSFYEFAKNGFKDMLLVVGNISAKQVRMHVWLELNEFIFDPTQFSRIWLSSAVKGYTREYCFNIKAEKFKWSA